MRRVQIDGGIADRMVITGEKAYHLARVLRIRPGERIGIAAIDGRAANAEVTSVTDTDIVLRFTEMETRQIEPRVKVGLALACLKGEKIEWALQKATELGVHEVGLFQAKNSVTKIMPDNMAKKAKRYEKIVAEAAEQCGRSMTPKVFFGNSLRQILPMFEGQPCFIALHEQEPELSLRNALKYATENSLVLVIGPEGGLAAEELQLECLKKVRFGARVLRAETAAVAALAVSLSEFGELD